MTALVLPQPWFWLPKSADDLLQAWKHAMSYRFAMTGRANQSLIQIIQGLSLTSGLQVCLDAGDAQSYTSGQPWLDRSGNGYDFNRGATSGSSSDDPTFNGTAGGLSSNEYWSLDGGDDFTYDSANETWMEALHKNNAIFTCIAAVYPGSNSNSQGIFGTTGNTNSRGVRFQLDATGFLRFRNINISSTVIDETSTLSYAASAWQIVGLSLDESNASSGLFFNNGSTDAFDPTYTSPSSSAAQNTMQIGAYGNDNGQMQSGSRIACFAMWNVALTSTQIGNIYTALRTRFGI